MEREVEKVRVAVSSVFAMLWIVLMGTIDTRAFSLSIASCTTIIRTVWKAKAPLDCMFHVSMIIEWPRYAVLGSTRANLAGPAILPSLVLIMGS